MSKHAITRLRNIYRKHTLLTICILLALFLIASIGVKGYIDRPRDLGPRLEYVGKDSYGCWWLVCDSTPGNTYYFATDMTPVQLAAYFRHATCRRADFGGTGNGDYNGYWIDCRGSDGSSFTITYYYNNDATVFIKENAIRNTDKHLVISIDKTDFSNAKAAL